MLRRSALLTSLAITFAAPASAAVSYQVSVDGNPPGSPTAQFTLQSPVNASIVNYAPNVFYLEFLNVSGIYGGQSGLADVRLYGGPGQFDGGLSVRRNSLPYFEGTGQQLFSLSGPTATLFSGTYSLVYNSTVVATTVPNSSVPEPAAWTMLIVGFGAVGAALRTRRRLPAVAA